MPAYSRHCRRSMLCGGRRSGVDAAVEMHLGCLLQQVAGWRRLQDEGKATVLQIVKSRATVLALKLLTISGSMGPLAAKYAERCRSRSASRPRPADRPLHTHVVGTALNWNCTSKTVISTGMICPILSCVCALYSLQNCMMLTPCRHSTLQGDLHVVCTSGDHALVTPGPPGRPTACSPDNDLQEDRAHEQQPSS